MTYGVQIILPDEVVEHLPKESQEWVPYLKKFFEASVIAPYEESLQRRQHGILGQPLSRYERTAYLDLLLDMALGALREKIEANKSHLVSLAASSL